MTAELTQKLCKTMAVNAILGAMLKSALGRELNVLNHFEVVIESYFSRRRPRTLQGIFDAKI